MTVLFQMTFSNAFSWMKMLVLWLKFNWNMFLRVQLTAFQHWFGYWLDVGYATNHYLNHSWFSFMMNIWVTRPQCVTVYPKKYAHGFCFAVLCCGYTLTDFPISIGLTSLALWQSNDCPSASKATLMNMDKYFMWIHYERLHNHNKAKHNKTVCIFLGIYCMPSDAYMSHSLGSLLCQVMAYQLFLR